MLPQKLNPPSLPPNTGCALQSPEALVDMGGRRAVPSPPHWERLSLNVVGVIARTFGPVRSQVVLALIMEAVGSLFPVRLGTALTMAARQPMKLS